MFLKSSMLFHVASIKNFFPIVVYHKSLKWKTSCTVPLPTAAFWYHEAHSRSGNQVQAQSCISFNCCWWFFCSSEMKDRKKAKEKMHKWLRVFTFSTFIRINSNELQCKDLSERHWKLRLTPGYFDKGAGQSDNPVIIRQSASASESEKTLGDMSSIPNLTASQTFPFSGDWCFMECYAEIFLNGKDRNFIVPIDKYLSHTWHTCSVVLIENI